MGKCAKITGAPQPQTNAAVFLALMEHLLVGPCLAIYRIIDPQKMGTTDSGPLFDRIFIYRLFSGVTPLYSTDQSDKDVLLTIMGSIYQ